MKANKPQKNNNYSWQLRKLDSMFTVRRGGSPRPIEQYITDREDGLNWLKIGDIDVGAKYITHTSSKILKEGLARTTLVKKGDFILSNSMSFGRPYIMDIDSCIHDGWLTFQEIKTNILDRDFLYYLLSQSKTQAIFTSISAGSGVQNLKKETVSEVELLIPPLLEQKRIVSVLETWDQLIEKFTRKIKIKNETKRVLMRGLMTGEKRLSGFKNKWEMVRLGDVSKITRGDSITMNDITHGDVPVIAGGQQPAYYHNKSNRVGKTITISGSGAYAGYVDFYDRPIFVSDGMSIQETKLNISFIYYFLKMNQDYIYSLQTGGAQPHVYPKDLQKLKLQIPFDSKEQVAIAEILTIADKEITSLEKKLSILKEQKKYLLNNLVTGKIRTPETLSAPITK